MSKRTINYLSNNVRDSIINDVKDIADFHARPDKQKEAGFFSIPRHVFCYVDYLGYIAFGYKHSNKTQSTKCAVDFIKKYFPDNYKQYAELIYSMWRHGTVHSYEPYTYFIKDSNRSPQKIKVLWLSNNDSKQQNRDAHLNFYPMERKRGTIYLAVNVCQLVDDLLSALDALIQDLSDNRTHKKEAEKRLNEFGKPCALHSIESKWVRTAIEDQILRAWQNRSPVRINEKGEAIKTNNNVK